jgi:hypothetical protein
MPCNQPIHEQKSAKSGCNQSQAKHQQRLVREPWILQHLEPVQTVLEQQQGDLCVESWVSKINLNPDWALVE